MCAAAFAGGCKPANAPPPAPTVVHPEDKLIAENAEARGEVLMRHELAMNTTVSKALGACHEMSGSGFHRSYGMPGGAGGPPFLVLERKIDCVNQAVPVWIFASASEPPGGMNISFYPVDWQTRGVPIDRIEISIRDPNFVLNF